MASPTLNEPRLFPRVPGHEPNIPVTKLPQVAPSISTADRTHRPSSCCYGPSIQPSEYQENDLNFPRKPFTSAPEWPGSYAQINVIHRSQQYPAPLKGYGSNKVDPSQGFILTPPEEIDSTPYIPFLFQTICSFL
jgi:hypothetical protein